MNMIVRELERLRLSFENAVPPIISTGSSDASISTPVPRVHVLASSEAPVVGVIGSSVSHDVPPHTSSEPRRSRSYTYSSSANPNVRATVMNDLQVSVTGIMCDDVSILDSLSDLTVDFDS